MQGETGIDAATSVGVETFGFYEVASTTPDRVAFVDYAADAVSPTTSTYGEVLARVNAVSAVLDRCGLDVGDVVAAVLPNGGTLSTVELGVVQLPLYFTPINRHLAVPEVAYILGDAGARLVFTAPEYEDAVRTAATQAGLGAGDVVVVDTDRLDALVAEHGAAAPAERSAGQRMLYTSGTTGHPKGVRRELSGKRPEDNLELVAKRASLYRIDHADGVHLVTAPMYHAAPGAYAVQALHLGHTVVIMAKWDAATCLELVERHRVTHTYMVPTMFNRLLELDPEQRGRHRLDSLRSVLHTAAPCPVHVKQAMMDWLGPVLFEIYGGTEGGATFVGPEDWLERPGTVGAARAGVEIRILDPDGESLPAGTPGAVYLSIPTQRFVYLNDPGKTAAARVGDFFTLGDIGYLDDDGYLFLCDRAADVVVSGGVNIYPAEIEGALLRHPAVVDAAVLGGPHADWGEELVAFVVARDGEEVDPAELEAHCRREIAGFKCPRRFELRPELPRSEAGKLLRRDLRDELWADHEGRI